MTPIAAIKSSLRNVFWLNGRAQRVEFWWSFLALFILTCLGVFANVHIFEKYDPIGTMRDYLSGGFVVFYSALFGFFLSITIRRLHDTNRSGWNFLYLLLPAGLGLIVLPIMLSQKGTVGFNNYGPDVVQAENLKAKKLYDEAEEFG